ncbi:hypothetical protein NFI96_011615 [Prochilodus magdalenae]|nr:hypothetical protein NFI96_011615 [Prochilodus magdalenae]
MHLIADLISPHRSTMKFVALALAVLLAVGCQARSMQADAPSKYEHIRAAVVTYLGQVKETAQKAIDRIDDKDIKDRLTLSLTRIETMLETAAESLKPVRDTIGPQVVEFASSLRERIEKDVEELQTELAPKREELHTVVKKHLDEYRVKLEPLLKEFAEKHREMMEDFRTKAEPVMKELHDLVKVNVEETKSKLTPIVEVIRSKLAVYIEEVKTIAEPYIQEYREHAERMRSQYESGAVHDKMTKLAEEVKPQLAKIFEIIQTHLSSTMKFVALALAVLLAAGCQARSLQADAPSQYEHVRAAVVTYLGQVKETAERAIDRIEDKEVKDYLTLSLNKIQGFLESASENLKPVRDTVGPQVMELISGLREKVKTDLEQLRKELAPKRQELHEVVKKHLEEYREKLEPLLKEYAEKNRGQMGSLPAKMEPVMKEMQEMIKTNVEETKSKLTPIVEVIRNKMTERLENLRKSFEPFVQEYREQVENALTDLRAKYQSGQLQTKVTNLAEELQPQLQKVFQTIHKAVTE